VCKRRGSYLRGGGKHEKPCRRERDHSKREKKKELSSPVSLGTGKERLSRNSAFSRTSKKLGSGPEMGGEAGGGKKGGIEKVILWLEIR